MRRFLFVGLGGSGGKTLRFLRHDLQNWLLEIGYKSMPVGWQFLHIDTPTIQDGRDITEVPMLPAESYVGLVGSGVGYSTVAAQLDGVVEGRDDLETWRVDPTHLQVPISVGAGQFRAVGRSIGLSYAGAVSQAISTAVNRLNTASASAELAEIHRLKYGTSDSKASDPFVVVISSIAGGTGAGLLLDTCDLIRQQGEWADHSFGLLYASDVFGEIGGMGTSGVQPNALAALSEVMNGYWLPGAKPRENSFFKRAGAPKATDRSGPAFPFLVGAANASGISFGNQRSIYAMMGRALVSWTTDIQIQDDLLAYTITNWENAARANAPEHENALVPKPVLSVFDAFGYAEVGLGTERFGRYASQRLAKTVARWLYEGHLIRARAQNPDDGRTPDEIVEQMALDLKLTVLKDLNLDERGTADQVIDALRPVGADAMFHAGVESVHRLASSGVDTADADTWTNLIFDSMRGVTDSYTRDYEAEVRGRAGEWVKVMPDRAREVVLNLVQEAGLRVAARTLELVSAELKLAVDELSEESAHYLRQAAEGRGAIRAELPRKGKYRGDNEQVASAVKIGFWTNAGLVGESIRRRIGAELITDFAEGYVEQLARALRYSFESLRSKGFEGEGSQMPQVLPWPDEAVTDALRPPKNEFLVLGIDEFPEEYVRLLSRSTRADKQHDQATEARDEVIDGLFMETDGSNQPTPRPIVETQTWHPRRGLVLGSASDRQPAAFALAFGPQDVLERADRWIRRSGTAFERFLSADLRTYLDDDSNVSPDEMGKRRQSFIAAFASSMAAAEPLVKISEPLRGQLHPTSKGKRANPTELPFKDHPMEAEVREVIHSMLLTKEGEQVVGRFTTSTNVRTIAISATLGAAHDPMVFKSITDPIVSGWSQAALANAGKVSFWNNRRARPLREFIPAPHGIIAAMTRGWFTGLFLGLIDWDKGLIHHERGPVPLPRHLLSSVGGRVHDRLPALLESLGLAMCEVSRVESITPLYPYVSMRRFGQTDGVIDMRYVGDYASPSPVLDEWIRTGTVTGSLTVGLADEELQSVPDRGSDTPRTRAAAFGRVAQQTLDRYKKINDKFEESSRLDPSRLGSNEGLMFGMYDIIEQALMALIAVVQPSDDDSARA